MESSSRIEMEVSPVDLLHVAVDDEVHREHHDDCVNDDSTDSCAPAPADLMASRIFDEPWRQPNSTSFAELPDEDFRIAAWKTKLARESVKLGAGAFGTVLGVKAQCDPTAEFALKIQQKPQQFGPTAHGAAVWEREILGEVAMMEALNTEQFVRILSEGPGHGRGPHMMDRIPRYSILMEKATGDMDKWTQANGYKSNYAQTVAFFIDLLEGLKIMKEKEYVHRDLKPANLMFVCPPEVAAELKSQKKTDIADKVCHAKVADLGMTCKKRACAGIAGSPLWIAPELQNKGTIDYSNDVWAMGEIFYEIIFQEKIPPLKTITTMQHLKTVKLMMKDQVVDAKKIVAQLIISPAEADKVKGLIEGMMRVDHTKRLTASAALELAKQLDVPALASAVESGQLPACWFEEDTAERVAPAVPRLAYRQPLTANRLPPTTYRQPPTANRFPPAAYRPLPLPPTGYRPVGAYVHRPIAYRPGLQPPAGLQFAAPAGPKPLAIRPARKEAAAEEWSGFRSVEADDVSDIGSSEVNEVDFVSLPVGASGYPAVGAKLVLEWVLGKYDWHELMKASNRKYLKEIRFPKRMLEEGKEYEPLAAAGIAVETLRRDLFINEEQLRNGFYGDSLVIKMLRVK
jgi:serine/threonine protein kinase